jgi:hypothetical protein
MRYEGQLLTEAESAALIDELDLWCRRTGTNYNKIVIAAGVAVSLRSMVRTKGKRVTITVSNRLRKAMREFGKGITRQEHRARLSLILSRPSQMSIDEIQQRRVNREPCPRCGVRADVGCKHSIWSANGGRLSTAA